MLEHSEYIRRLFELTFSVALLSSKDPRLLGSTQHMMKIHILVFMVLAIQVCFITCVDLDQILTAVEEEQEATRKVSPTPGFL